MSRSMTIDEFLVELRKASRPGGFWICAEGFIRDGQDCPITKVANYLGLPKGQIPFIDAEVTDAGLHIGLTEHDMLLIARTSDRNPKYTDPKLRARILEACGLKEKL